MNCISCTIPISDGNYCTECRLALDIVILDKMMSDEDIPDDLDRPKEFNDMVNNMLDKMAEQNNNQASKRNH